MKHTFSDTGDLRKYFAALPNIVFTLGLNPYELALYAHFKQAAGDSGGVCWKSRATIAKESGMSSGMVTKARVALEKPREEIGGRPLIIATEQVNSRGGRPTWHIAITDIWASNMTRFSTSHSDIANQPTSLSVSTTSHGDGATSPHAHKEKPIKKNPEEVKTLLIADPRYATINVESELVKMSAWLDDHKGRQFNKRFAVNWLESILEQQSAQQAIAPRKVSDPAYQKELEQRWLNQGKKQA